MDGRPVKLQLCDTAGQVSITSMLSARQEQGLLKAFRYCPLLLYWAILGPHPSSQRVEVAGTEPHTNKTGFGTTPCGRDKGNRVKGGSYLLGVSDLIYFLVFIKNCQWCSVLISQSKLVMPYNHFIKGQQTKFLRYWLKKKMEFMSVILLLMLM